MLLTPLVHRSSSIVLRYPALAKHQGKEILVSTCMKLIFPPRDQNGSLFSVCAIAQFKRSWSKPILPESLQPSIAASVFVVHFEVESCLDRAKPLKKEINWIVIHVSAPEMSAGMSGASAFQAVAL